MLQEVKDKMILQSRKNLAHVDVMIDLYTKDKEKEESTEERGKIGVKIGQLEQSRNAEMGALSNLINHFGVSEDYLL